MTAPHGSLGCLIVVLPDHTHLPFIGKYMTVWYLSHNEHQTIRRDWCSLTRAFANRTKKKGCRLRLKSNSIGKFKKVYVTSGESGETEHLRSIARALQITLKRMNVDEGSVKSYKPV